MEEGVMSERSIRKSLQWVGFCLTTAISVASSAEAAENGRGVYLLGFRGPLAGITPPPGFYFQNDLYLYSASVGKSFKLPDAGDVIAGIDAHAVLNLATTVWVTPAEIFGGNLGFTATVPIGGSDVSAFLGRFGVDDSLTTIGDPFVSTFIGWNAGNFHWQTGVAVNVPIGNYQDGNLANIAFHYWAADVFGTLTYLDPMTGIDISNAIGFTFDAENPATNYLTGDQFHWEWAVSKYLTKNFSAGVIGYYYQQFTGDSGSGAVLGSFEGSTTAIGATLAYNFQLGSTPVSARLKYYHEFDVKNRLPADTGFVTVSFPLGVPRH
jgi:hypothetical protein